ncbi:aminoacyl-tRNA hydrolase [Lactobacillaceae bacterium L1_55_11]|nr:aminoacyl-tRNA hydrolase [Lactobacillaceae bacterium L1_55_11]
MKFIFGLGNIGVKYDGTRHNIGFMALDHYAQTHQLSFTGTKLYAQAADTVVDGERVFLVKPTTYMNDSGQAVRAFLDFYGAHIDDVLILVDDMDLPLGKLRFRQRGSAGGHNGLKSIMVHTDTQAFLRLKFGVGHPQHEKQAVINYVLGKFSPAEMKLVDDMLTRSDEAIDAWIAGADVADLSNRYNG